MPSSLTTFLRAGAALARTGLLLLLLGACTERGDGETAAADAGSLAAPAAPAGSGSLSRIRLPPGFSIAVYTDKVPGARSLALSPKGVLYVGTRGQGKVYAVLDADRDGKAETVKTVASGLTVPNGVAWKDGSLWVAENSRLLLFEGLDSRLDDPPAYKVLYDNLPRDRHHGWKFIRFGPDGWLYVPVGAPCNVCLEKEPIYSSIARIKPDGTGIEVFAHGIRNTVGFDWHPATRELWFTENGRDMMGDDIPPDELNRAPRAGLHFGFPHCHGGTIPDPEFGKGKPCAGFVAPERNLGPHVAALGMRFYTGTMFPPQYRGQVFFAEHGSWNRSKPIGYRVMMVRLEGGKAVSYEPFAEGWLRGGDVSGRPVDVEVLPDGSMLVSDDEAGAIYRITYQAPKG